MSSPDMDIPALIGSRICHDLISPVGAIGNGLELMALSGAAGPEMELIQQSAENASARIRFFRLAFGAGSPGQSIAARELGAVLNGYFSGTRVTFSTDLPGPVDRDRAKLALLLLLCVETALIRGGEIRCDFTGPVNITATGPAIVLEDRLRPGLVALQPPADLGAAEVQFALLPRAAQEAGVTPAVDIGQTTIRIRA